MNTILAIVAIVALVIAFISVIADAILLESNPDQLFLGVEFTNTIDPTGETAPQSFFRVGIIIVQCTWFFIRKPKDRKDVYSKN